MIKKCCDRCEKELDAEHEIDPTEVMVYHYMGEGPVILQKYYFEFFYCHECWPFVKAELQRKVKRE